MSSRFAALSAPENVSSFPEQHWHEEEEGFVWTGRKRVVYIHTYPRNIKEAFAKFVCGLGVCLFFGSLEGPVPACGAINQRIAWDALVVEFALVFFTRQFEEDADAMLFVSSGRLVSCLLLYPPGEEGVARVAPWGKRGGPEVLF